MIKKKKDIAIDTFFQIFFYNNLKTFSPACVGLL